MKMIIFLSTMITIFCPICHAKKPVVDWKRVLVSDTLDVLLNGKRAGVLRSGYVFDGSEIEASTVLTVENTGALMIGVVEKRRYDGGGNLKSAYQEINSPSGKTVWELKKSNDAWTCTVVTAGVRNSRPVAPVNENLYNMYALYDQLKSATLKVGDSWVDTVFELTSGEPVVNTTRCVESPDKNENSTWVLVTANSLQGKEQRWELDKQGKTLYHEVTPFVAVKQGSGVSPVSIEDLFETFSVRVSKAPKPGSIITLQLDSATSIDSSVSAMYELKNGKYILSAVPCSCTGGSTINNDSLKEFLQPTATLQIDHPDIIALAMKLDEKSGACEKIQSYTGYVHKNLEKRNTATFSSAVETLHAGYGDCGEHAVLLAALLRASGVPARVVLGLVYLDSKKGYFGHAWVMAFTGKTWIFTDPALGNFSACHDRIPLLVDDTGQKMVRLVKLLGKIKIQVD